MIIAYLGLSYIITPIVMAYCFFAGQDKITITDVTWFLGLTAMSPIVILAISWFAVNKYGNITIWERKK